MLVVKRCTVITGSARITYLLTLPAQLYLWGRGSTFSSMINASTDLGEQKILKKVKYVKRKKDRSRST